MHVSRLLGAVACLALLCPARLLAQVPVSLAGQEPTLHALVESAWQRSPYARTLLARQEEARAGADLAGSWTASPPVLGLAQRSDRWTDKQERRETEVSLAASLWLPSQQARRADLAHAGVAEIASLIALARLDIAGQVRSRLWAAVAAHETEREREDHWRHLQELAQDVARRVAAGDVPRADALLAQQEVSTARMTLVTARRDSKAAMARLSVLTGVVTLPALPHEAPPEGAEPVAVRLQAAQAAERRARAAVAAAPAQANAAPAITLSMRRERDGKFAPSDRSIGIALHIPLVGKQRNRALESAAATQLANASAELALTAATLESELELARSQLLDAEERLAQAELRAAAAQEHTRLFQRAFELGERSLADFLRSRIQHHEAQMAVRQERAALGLARAELNQALGIVP
jgi:outer membrane protein TolC